MQEVIRYQNTQGELNCMGASLDYLEKLKLISEKLVEIQKPIRILDSIKWNRNIESEFFKNKAKELPKIDSEFYKNIQIGFDPAQKRAELKDLIQEIHRELGIMDEMGQFLQKMCEQYIEVVHMIEARGSKNFWHYSRRLYGSPQDRFYDDGGSILEQAKMLHQILDQLDSKNLGPEYEKNLSAEECVESLRSRFDVSPLKGKIQILLSDGIVADAAAGADSIKIKSGAMFSQKDVDIFEVHEGWVHIATTANGKSQSFAKCLAKGPPRCTATQEGLAFLMEMLTFSTYPKRALRVNNRIIGIDMAEQGADFIEVYNYYLNQDHDEVESFQNTMRVFRGGVISGGAPFTKDISYCRGLIENYNFMRTAIREGRPELIPFLYVGKIHVEDIPMLYQKHLEGIVEAPRYLPPQFQDLNGLAVWMSFSNFFNKVNLAKVQEHYQQLFHQYL